MKDNLGYLKQTLTDLERGADSSRIRELLSSIAREIPKTPECLTLHEQAFRLADSLTEVEDRRVVLLNVVREIPHHGVYRDLYLKANEAAIIVCDAMEEHHRRTTELLKIANDAPKTPEFKELRRHAWRLVLGLPDKPRFVTQPVENIAKELPKASDLAFYRRYTILGIAKQVPLDDFMDIYMEAIQLAVDAVAHIKEPHYRKYALLFIAKELPERKEVADLYRQVMIKATKASYDINDPFAKEHALIDMIREVPKTTEFLPLLQDVITQSLSFFTVRKRMEDLEVTDVVDFILSAEELGMKESKKRRFSREKYANQLAAEIEEFGLKTNDTRLIEVLKPYSHVWVRPKPLRDAVRKVVEHLESLTKTFHGREVARPVFVKEAHRESSAHASAAAGSDVGECISIDLGATNTVIMRKKGDARPDFVVLGDISRKYENTYIVPTVIGAETNVIGTEVNEASPIVNIKQMLLDGNPKGREHMERYFRTLYQHLKNTIVSPGWFSIISRSLADKLYITVPVGFDHYRKSMREIAGKTVKGMKAEFIEEPLAAAVGYEVAEAREKVVMVIDFGGSTLNTMVLRLNIDGLNVVAKPERAQVLGGYDIDLWLASHLAAKAAANTGDLPYELIAKAEEIKIGLSKRSEMPFEWNGSGFDPVTREEFEEVLERNDFYRTVDRVMSNVLSKAEKVGIGKNRIEAVLLTGGSSQIPSFKDKIGHIFPDLRSKNEIYDHSPLSAVGRGAALYGTKDVVDRHLGMAYALRYALEGEKEAHHSYGIVLEKGESLPLEKTYLVSPARKLGEQKEIYIELFEVPESLITRRWVVEGGREFIKQELQHTKDIALASMQTVTLDFDGDIDTDVEVTFIIDESGHLSIKYGVAGKTIATGLRLQ